MSKTSFVLKHILIGAVVCYTIYAVYLTRLQLPFGWRILSWGESVWLLASSFLVLTYLGIIATIDRRRNSESIFINILLSTGLVCAIMAQSYYPIPVAAAFVLCAVLVVFYSVKVMTHKLPAGGGSLDIIIRRMGKVVHMSRHLAATAVILCIALLFSVLIFGAGASYAPNIMPDHLVVPTDNSLIKTNYVSIRKINEPFWSGLSDREKLDVLQSVANVEATYLGLPGAISIKSGALPLKTAGEYCHKARTIEISRDFLQSSARDCLILVLKFSYLSYQHSLSEAYGAMDEQFRDLRLFGHIDVFYSEFSEYSMSADGHSLRTTLMLANMYAHTSVDEYFEIIENLRREFSDPLPYEWWHMPEEII
jgi:energy-converting hydrogenase Eha subunit C